MHRFFIKQPLGEELEIKEKSLLHQWKNVLKFKRGESLILFNGSENLDYTYSLSLIEKGNAVLEPVSQKENLSQEKEGVGINLCISLIKKENLDLIFEKCTEIGVSSFAPIISERVEKKNIASFNKERGEKIIKEGVEQSGWGNMPTLNDPVTLEKYLKRLEDEGCINNVIVADLCSDLSSPSQGGVNPTYLFIGPEGGWTENEREIFKRYDLKVVSFGKNTLRAETAAIVGCFEMIK
ncbi:MAG: hypothetical protein RI945_374 [Candidatus Parcubacteria bacterium]